MGHLVEQAERIAEVPRLGGRKAVGEGVEEVGGGGKVEEAVGGGEDGVELGHLPHGARGRPGRRGHGAARSRRRRTLRGFRLSLSLDAGKVELALFWAVSDEAVIRPK